MTDTTNNQAPLASKSENTKGMTINMGTEGKSLLVAYVLWWFLGWLGLHRFYLNKPVTAVIQAILAVVGGATVVFLVGIPLVAIFGIWWLIDAYLVQKHVKRINEERGVITGSGFTFSATPTGSNNNLDEIERLHKLYKDGALTEEQYNQKREELL